MSKQTKYIRKKFVPIIHRGSRTKPCIVSGCVGRLRPTGDVSTGRCDTCGVRMKWHSYPYPMRR